MTTSTLLRRSTRAASVLLGITLLIGAPTSIVRAAPPTAAQQSLNSAAAGLGQARAQLLPDGQFIQIGSDPSTWVIAGGAPIHVDSWAPYGGPRPVTWVMSSSAAQLATVPADGTFVATAGEGRVYQVVGGAFVYVDSWAPFGGPQPFTWIPPGAVTYAGEPGTRWWNLNKNPRDNTFVATAGEGKVYQLVGGAPIYVDSWAPFGGPQPYLWVSPGAIAGAGTGLWTTLRRTVPNGYLVATAGEGRVYGFAGGAPIYIDRLDTFHDPKISAWVSPRAVSAAGTGPWSNLNRVPVDGTPLNTNAWPYSFVFVGGALVESNSYLPPGPATADTGVALTMTLRVADEAGTGPWSALRRLPADGTFIATHGEGKVYEIVGGAPVYVDSWDSVGGPKPFTWVSPGTVSSAGSYEPWHLRASPADGTFLATHGEGKVYQIVGGAPIHVDSWAALGGTRPYVWVSPRVVSGAGWGPWSNLRRQPADGTFVATAGQGKAYQFVGGAPVYVDSWNRWGGPQPYTWVTPGAVASAGSGPWFNLNRLPADGTFVVLDGVRRFVGGSPVRTYGDGTPIAANLNHLAGRLGTGPWSGILAEPRDGTFVAGDDGKLYRYAGGTPLYVDSWAPFGTPQPYTVLSHYSLPGGLLEESANRTPNDGTFVRTPDGRAYRYAGGAAFYVTDWASFGGQKPTTLVSSGVIDLAGSSAWPTLTRTPADGTFVSVAGGTDSYVMVGGAPVWIDSWDAWGGPQPTVQVSAAVLTSPQWGPWSNILRTPRSGTQVKIGAAHYLVTDGRLVPLPPNPPRPAPPVWFPNNSVTLPTGLLAGAGTGKWTAILPPA